jgi:glycosyltransferase involved in cell wall biosynthesis
LHKLLFKRILKSMPVICSTSQDMAREAALYVNKDYIITPFGVDTDRFRPLGQKHEIFTLGTVKSLEAVYGVDRLINAYHQFRQQYTSPSRLLIYGSGSQEAALKQLVRTLQLEDSVEFVGFVRGEALVQAFNSLDVFLALSRRESFGVAALEAQSCGVPVIVSRVGGLPEVVSGESGYLVEGEDVEAAAMKMLELTDASKREIMGAAARKFVVEHFSQDVCVDRMLAVYARFWHK